MIIHDLKLDICPNMKRNEVWVSQYDTDFLIRITLFASKGTFTVESGTTAAIRGTKPDGNGYSANASISGNVVTVTGAEQMTVVAGRSVYEVTLYRNGKELNTVNFNLRVEHAALDKDTPTSRSQTRELVSIEEHADEIIENVRNMEVFAGDSEAYALGTRGGEAVGTDDPAYQNNSKWYAEQNIPDTTLAISGRPADAKATGDQLTSIKDDLNEVTETIQGTVERKVYTPIQLNIPAYTFTQSGITIVQNSNGTIRVYGTASSTVASSLKDASGQPLPVPLTAGKTYRLQGCPAGGANNKYQLDIRRTNTGGALYIDYGSGTIFKITETASYIIKIRVEAGQTIDLIFTPEIAEETIIEETGERLNAVDLIARESENQNSLLQKLLHDNIPQTVQSYTFIDGTVSKVEHKNGNDVVRSDVFSYESSSITETRTLSTGESLTIATDLTTLETTITYTAA